MREQKKTIVLGKKLLAIRLWRGLSQTQILHRVFPRANSNSEQRAMVSQWEHGEREPSRETLINYAGFAGITLEELMIDSKLLPPHIAPANPQNEANAKGNFVRRSHQPPAAEKPSEKQNGEIE
jgi:transcriptional regulator with XRE-family HTH domain